MPKSLLGPLLSALVFCPGMSPWGTLNSVVAGTAHQSATTSLRGVAIDDSGAVIGGAEVTLLNPATGFQRETTTNDEGAFAFDFLPPGAYRVTITKPGFAAVVIEGLTLNVNDPRAIRVRLKVGAVHEVIAVRAETDLRDSPAASAVIDRQFVGNLPLNGRSFLPLITLAPGIANATTPTAASPWLFAVNGQRPNTNYLMVDGVSANIAAIDGSNFSLTATGALPGFSIFGGLNNLVSIDALQEIKVLTSANAPELGRTPGAQISIVTRSGTSQLHGALFDYVRNEALDANDWFANRGGQPKPPLRQNDFGGVLGGPLPLPGFGAHGLDGGGDRKTFFFFSYEGLRVRQPQVAVTQVPSLILRRVAADSIRPFLDAFPLPNGADRTNPGFQPFIASYSNPSTMDAASLRIDHNVNARLQVFGRRNLAPSANDARAPSVPSTINRTAVGTGTLTLGATFSPAPRLSADLRFNESKVDFHNAWTIDAFGGATPPADSQIFPPFVSRKDAQVSIGVAVPGSAGQLLFVGDGDKNAQRQRNLVVALSLSTGRTQMKFGVDYRALAPRFTPPAYTLRAAVSDFPKIEAGVAGIVTVTAQDSSAPRFTNFSAFWEAAWSGRPRLNLIYGARWEVNPAPSSAEGARRQPVIELESLPATRLAPAEAPLWPTTYNNFAPRFGAVYQLSKFRDLETVVRGGAGLFYDLVPGTATAVFLSNSRSSQLLNAPFPLDPSSVRPPSLDGPAPAASSFLGFGPNLKLPYSLQWNFALEQSLGPDQTITATYVGARGSRLFNTQWILSSGAEQRSVRAIKNEGRSAYHALQIQFQRRLSRGLQARAGYTWSHSIDLVSDEARWGLAKGPSDFDLRHIVSAAVTYDLPAPAVTRAVGPLLRGWSLDSVVRAQSSSPVNVIIASGPILFGPFMNYLVDTLRPNLVSGAPLYIKDPQAPGGKRINPAAFAPQFSGVPTVNTPQGTLGRNALRGFPFRQVDLSMRRQFHLSDRVGIQFKADLFNLLNQSNFNNPNGILYSGFSDARSPTLNPSFGLSDSLAGRNGKTSGVIGGLYSLYQAGGPRSIQLSLKLQF
jgi:hypothetical protein